MSSTQEILIYLSKRHKLEDIKNSNYWKTIIDYSSYLNKTNDWEIAYLFKNQLTSTPVCGCGKHLPFHTYNTGYRKYCSLDCSYAKQNMSIRRQASAIASGGIGSANPETFKKAQQTWKDKHGVTNPGQLRKGVSKKSAPIN